jgi:hypothetical protein
MTTLFVRVNNGLRNQLCKVVSICSGVELADHMIVEVKNYKYTRTKVFLLCLSMLCLAAKTNINNHGLRDIH